MIVHIEVESYGCTHRSCELWLYIQKLRVMVVHTEVVSYGCTHRSCELWLYTHKLRVMVVHGGRTIH